MRIKNKTSWVNLRKSDAAVDHSLSQPAIGRHRRVFEEEFVDSQYLPGMVNTMLIDFAKQKKGALAEGGDGSGDESEGEVEDGDAGDDEDED